MPYTNLNQSYAEQGRGFPGMLTDARQKVAETYVQGEATLGIAFGAAVIEGPPSVVSGTPDNALNLVNGSGVLAGVVLHSHNFDRRSQLDANGAVLPTNLITVLKWGQVFMSLEGTCVKGQPAFARFAANGAGKTLIGGVRADADGGTAVSGGAALTFGETITTNVDGLVMVNVNINT